MWLVACISLTALFRSLWESEWLHLKHFPNTGIGWLNRENILSCRQLSVHTVLRNVKEKWNNSTSATGVNKKDQMRLRGVFKNEAKWYLFGYLNIDVATCYGRSVSRDFRFYSECYTPFIDNVQIWKVTGNNCNWQNPPNNYRHNPVFLYLIDPVFRYLVVLTVSLVFCFCTEKVIFIGPCTCYCCCNGHSSQLLQSQHQCKTLCRKINRWTHPMVCEEHFGFAGWCWAITNFIHEDNGKRWQFRKLKVVS